MSFILKVRGTPTRTIIADYYCDVHGRFELEVDRDEKGDAPDVVPCPQDGQLSQGGGCLVAGFECGRPAIYCISAPLAKVRLVEAVKGKWEKPARATYTDTRNIGEGQPLYEWKEDRAKVWEEKRKQDVVRFARENNERIRGD